MKTLNNVKVEIIVIKALKTKEIRHDEQEAEGT